MASVMLLTVRKVFPAVMDDEDLRFHTEPGDFSNYAVIAKGNRIEGIEAVY